MASDAIVLPQGLTNLCSLTSVLLRNYKNKRLHFILDKSRRGINAIKFLSMIGLITETNHTWIEISSMKDNDITIISDINTYGPRDVARRAWGINIPNLNNFDELLITHPSYYTSVLYLGAANNLRARLVIPVRDSRPLSELFPGKTAADSTSHLCNMLNSSLDKTFFVPYNHPLWNMPGVSPYEMQFERIDVISSIKDIRKLFYFADNNELSIIQKQFQAPICLFIDCGIDYPNINQLELITSLACKLKSLSSLGFTLIAKPIPGCYKSTIGMLERQGIIFSALLPEHIPAELCIEILMPARLLTVPSTCLQSVDIESTEIDWINIPGIAQSLRDSFKKSYSKILPSRFMHYQTSY
jgi:hypothetical protein